MLHEIGVELAAALRTKKCPIGVVDGPEPMGTTTWGRERIVIEHDDEGGDAFSHVLSQHKNPKHRATRAIGVKVTIYAQSTRPGALHWEHRRRAEHTLDIVVVALADVITARKNAWRITGGKFVTPPDLDSSEKPGGAVYELKFTVDRGVYEQKWTGEIRPQMTMAKKAMTGFPLLTFAEVGASGDTITRSTGSWIDDGFLVGDTITVRGSTSNNVTGPIASLTATVLTLDTTDLINEGPIASCAVTAGGAKSCTHVSSPHGSEDEPACGTC
jgi:hypothetical protein